MGHGLARLIGFLPPIIMQLMAGYMMVVFLAFSYRMAGELLSGRATHEIHPSGISYFIYGQEQRLSWDEISSIDLTKGLKIKLSDPKKQLRRTLLSQLIAWPSFPDIPENATKTHKDDILAFLQRYAPTKLKA